MNEQQRSDYVRLALKLGRPEKTCACRECFCPLHTYLGACIWCRHGKHAPRHRLKLKETPPTPLDLDEITWICRCGHSVLSHADGPGACDGEGGACEAECVEMYAEYGVHDRTGERVDLKGNPVEAST